MRSRIPGDSLRDSEAGEDRELGEILSFGDAPERCFASADSLNNAAVSLMEAGREAEAERIWRAALLKEPGHADSFFNREIFLRRKGRRTTKEVYVSLEKAGIAERADVAADLAQECGAVPEPVQAHGYQFNLGTHFLDAQVDGGEIRFLYTENNAIRILVFDRLNGTQIKRNFMSRLLKTDEPVRTGAFLPDGQRYVLVTDRISVNHLYDPQIPAVRSAAYISPLLTQSVSSLSDAVPTIPPTPDEFFEFMRITPLNTQSSIELWYVFPAIPPTIRPVPEEEHVKCTRLAQCCIEVPLAYPAMPAQDPPVSAIVPLTDTFCMEALTAHPNSPL